VGEQAIKRASERAGGALGREPGRGSREVPGADGVQGYNNKATGLIGNTVRTAIRRPVHFYPDDRDREYAKSPE